MLSELFSKERGDKVIDSIFEHLGSRSMVDLLTRVFSIEDSNFIDERFRTFERMIDFLNKSESLDVITCLI